MATSTADDAFRNENPIEERDLFQKAVTAKHRTNPASALTVSFWAWIPLRYSHFRMLSGVRPARTISSFGSFAALSQAPSLKERKEKKQNATTPPKFNLAGKKQRETLTRTEPVPRRSETVLFFVILSGRSESVTGKKKHPFREEAQRSGNE